MTSEAGAGSGAPAGALPAAPPMPPPLSLPPGWTQSTAPTGHTYYYNAQTGVSTYRHPALLPHAAQPPPPPPAPPAPPAPPLLAGHGPAVPPQAQGPAPFLRLSDPRVANAFMQQHAVSTAPQNHSGRPQNVQKPRRQPHDKPRSRIPIPGHEPWVLVYTKYGRRFVHNPAKNASFWRIPEKLLPAILELDVSGVHSKSKAPDPKTTEAAAPSSGDPISKTGGNAAHAAPAAKGTAQADDDESDYEEVEVSEDDEDGSEYADGGRPKRQKLDYDPDGALEQGPVEFSEADILYQLQAVAEEEAGGQEDLGWEEDEGGTGDGDTGAARFKSLLDDFKINPFSSWEKLMEEGKIFDDERYTALPTMKARKAVWEEWSRDAIRTLKEEKKANAGRQDPRTAYLRFLEDHATPKLYWPEFKRKYRKEPPLKDASLTDKEKERMYRDHIARLKLPSSTLKADLTKLLDSIPRSKLHNQTTLADLPPQLTGDIRYISLQGKQRDKLVEAYLKTVGPPPTE